MAGSPLNHDRNANAPQHACRVLVVAGDAQRRAWVNKALKQDDCSCAGADSTAEALTILSKYEGGSEAAFDAVVIDVPACTPAALKLVRALGLRRVPALLICPHVTFDEAVAVMKAGATDIVGTDVKPRELTKRVRAAVKQKQTTPARKNGAEKTMAATTTDEFTRLINCELDVEALLRHALEFVLAKVGPTNAAVFLPGSTGEYALGAYVNLSCPKDTAEVMLDHLANIAAPRLESTVGILDVSDPAKLRSLIGEGADWLEQQRVLAFACRQENECLAVFMLFREKGQPFPLEATPVLTMIREEFGKQLARVIRIHHRHLPRDQWGALGDGWDSADDSDDLAA